jgi:hypothetical protein
MQAIADEGFILTSPSGNKRGNPLLRELRSVQGQMIKIAGQLKLGNPVKFDELACALGKEEYWL